MPRQHLALAVPSEDNNMTSALTAPLKNTTLNDTADSDAGADKIFSWTVASAATLVMVLLLAAAFAMLWGGRLAFQTFGLHFFVDSQWDAVAKQFGALVPIFGTLVSSLIAMLIAVPVSFGIAFYLTEIAPTWLRGPVATAVELLAGIPSIIYGMWGLFVFVPFMSDYILPWLDEHVGTLPFIGPVFQGPPLGIGMLTAGIVLAIMVIPFISSIMRDVFKTVPSSLKESAYALGATNWEVVWNVVLPYCRSAVVGGIFLGLGRALGETMAVTFVLGNSHQLSWSILMPGNSIAATIANEFTEADSDIYLSSLIALGFILFIVTFIVLAIARIMLHNLSQKEGHA